MLAPEKPVLLMGGTKHLSPTLLPQGGACAIVCVWGFWEAGGGGTYVERGKG